MWLLSQWSSIASCQVKGNIDNYLKLLAVPDKDTVSEGDTFSLKVAFQNKTDSPVAFYPEGFLALVRKTPAFYEGFYTYTLNIIQNLAEPHILEPFKLYKNDFQVPVLVYTSYSEAIALYKDSFRSVSIPTPTNSDTSIRNQTKTVKIKVFPFLRKGKNILFIHYGTPGKPMRKKKEHTELYGILESNQFEIFVK